MEDDYYNGYFIPAGTVVITNQWYGLVTNIGYNVHRNFSHRAMLYDENEYPDPEVFCPERFLPVNGGGMPLDPRKVAFGFGRRLVTCGYHSGCTQRKYKVIALGDILRRTL